jgi:glycosyltransferase involved in cell wall biosynthesis
MFTNIRIDGYDTIETVRDSLGEVDKLVVIPSKNAAETIAYVVMNSLRGLERITSSGAVIVIDGLSSDSTVEIVNVLKKRHRNLFIIPNITSPGKGGAMKTGVEIADLLNANTLVFVDSDLRSITPEWIILLAEGAEKQGYSTPYYIRDRFDATITNFVARPLTTTAYLIDISQPIGGDFGLSGKLIKYLARRAPWNNCYWNLLFGTDIFITHTALHLGIVPVEAYLGSKIHEAKDPGKSLKGMFIEVTGSLFTALIEYAETWTRKKGGVVKPEIIKEPKTPIIPPPRITVDKEYSLKMFRRVSEEPYKSIIEKLGESKKIVMEALYADRGLNEAEWAWILIETYRLFIKEQRYLYRNMILDTLYHLWQGRLYSYYREVEDLGEDEVRAILDKQVHAVENLREELVKTTMESIMI